MRKEIKKETIYWVLFIIILIAMIFLHKTDIDDNQQKQIQIQEIEQLEKRIEELEQEMESYRENYTALWTTVNTYHKKQ